MMDSTNSKSIDLYSHQIKAIEQLDNGSILCGGVGSGKSRAALGYFYIKEGNGQVPINGHGEFTLMRTPKDLYIITTARKRDTFEWELECAPFLMSKDPELGQNKLAIDSWNNIGKYTKVKDSFFIFDEQRVVGKGAWVKSFLEITKHNRWILLSATPGDTWTDYIPVFIANGFYRNRTDFERQHIVWSRFAKYPKVDRYLNVGKLVRQRKAILVDMKFRRETVHHNEIVVCDYDKQAYNFVAKERWDIFNDKPIQDASGYCITLRRIVNSDPSRLAKVKELVNDHPKSIIFYNFNYELDLLRQLGKDLDILVAEWNGHKHEPLPKADRWLYLVQYTAGAEGWNCIETDTIIFYSQNYSYKVMVQAAGRIDRMNTPYKDLYFYKIRSKAPIDLAIAKTLMRKQTFNEKNFVTWK